MLPPHLAVETVIVVEPVTVDDRGTPVADWTQTPATLTPVPGCSIQPAGSAETMGDRQQTEARYTAYLPGTPLVTERSAIDWRGSRYLVDGTPEIWPDPLDRLTYTLVRMVKFRG